MLSRLTIARWTLDVDSVATSNAYTKIDSGSADRCGCADCRNFVAARDTLFPKSVSQFLRDAGIPNDRDIELATFGEIRDGIQLYSGWYHFVGRIADGPDAAIPHEDGKGWSIDLAPVTDAFSIGVTNHLSLLADAFPRESALQLEFTVELPLQIDTQP
ncbi:MAG: hypothetical protein AAF483_17625 [Planctomycetota bacterium]